MKTRVASVILDTHTQDIDSVASYAEEVSAGASEATSWAVNTFEYNLSSYAEETGDSLSDAFSASAITLDNMSKVAAGQQDQINSNHASAVTKANQLESVSYDIIKDMARDTMQGSMERIYWNQLPPGDSPEDGDILWEIPNGDDWSSAIPHKFIVSKDNPQGKWENIEYTKQFFGSKIYGAEIHAGKIFGLELISQLNNFYHRPVFSLSKDGWVYAQNLTTDIFNAVSSGHNGRSYDNGMTNPDVPEKNRGFNMMNGIMSFKAMAHRNDTTVSSIKDYYAQTFLEPDMIKFRSYTNMFDGAWDKESDIRLIARTDIQSGRIDINDTFGDDSGFTARPTYLRVGEWRDDGKHTDKSGVVMSYYGDFHKLHVHKDSFVVDPYSEFNGTIYAKNGIVVEKGGLTVDGKNVKNSNDDSDTSVKNGFTTSGTIALKYGNVDIQNGQVLAQNMSFFRGGINVEAGGFWVKNGRPWESRGVRFDTWTEIYGPLTVNGVLKGSSIQQTSDKSLKKNFREVNSEKVLSQLVATDIVKYNYKDVLSKDAEFIGPIIDDVDSEKEYYIPEELVARGTGEENNSLITNNYISYLTLGIKELAKQNQQLMFRLAKLEREGK